MLLVSWLNSLRRCFGTSFHILVFSIYWAQGFRAFPWTGISILAKDHRKPVVPLPLPFPPPFHPITASHCSSFFPQTHSYPRVPLDGNLHSSEEPSEAGPSSSAAYDLHCLHDVEREAVIWLIPYIIIANALSLLSWLALPLPATSVHPFSPGSYLTLALTFVPSLAAFAEPFTLLLVLQIVEAAMADVVIDAMVAEAAKGEKTSAALADVVIDAMVAEAAKGEKERYAGDLQSLSWFSMAAGGVVGNLLGGPALKTLQPHGMFALFAFFPLSQLTMCFMSSKRKLTGGTGSGEEDKGDEEEEVEGVEEEEWEGEEGERVRESGKVVGASEGDKRVRDSMSDGTTATAPSCLEIERASDATWDSVADSLVTIDCGSSHGNRMNGGSESEESGELGEWEQVVPEQAIVARKKDGEEERGGGEEGGGEKSAAREQSIGLRQRRGREGGDGEGGKGNAVETGRAEGAEEARKRRSEERSRRKAAGGLGREVLNLVMVLWHAVMSPEILWPMAWFMISCTVVPTITSSLFYFHTNRLHLDISFLGSTKNSQKMKSAAGYDTVPTSPNSLTHSSIPQSSACHPSLPPHPFFPLAPLRLPPPPSSTPPRSLAGRAIYLFLGSPFSTSPASPLATPGLPPPPALPSRPPQGHWLGVLYFHILYNMHRLDLNV
ncbi:unnamed protein product [Closterium sp. Naga37s-1]|nr:unnamed protein product [Closterium sp. Naga37s-1]